MLVATRPCPRHPRLPRPRPDLRGHGLSPRGPYSPDTGPPTSSTPSPTTRPGHRTLPRRHVLALAAAALHVKSAIYVDPAWKLTTAQELAFKTAWSPELDWTIEQWLEAHPLWAAGDITARLSSIKYFDPACIDGLLTGQGYDHMPRALTCPSLALLAHPSEFVPHDDATHLQDIGMEVWALPQTTHSMHREDYDLFLLAIDRWRTTLNPHPQ